MVQALGHGKLPLARRIIKSHLLEYTILTLKMTTTRVVKTSVTNDNLSKDYPHPDNHTKQINIYYIIYKTQMTLDSKWPLLPY